MPNKGTILIIEDEENIRDFISTSLRAQDYKTVDAKTAAEGMTLAASLCPDVILLDLGLPDMDGMEVIRSVRAWSMLPILVISARSREKEKVEALEDGSGKVVVAYRFDGWESASAFLEEEIFVGAALATAGEGRIDAAALKSVKDDAPLSEEQLMQDTGSSVLITDIKGNVYCPGKVTYISEGAFVNPDGSVNTSDTEGTVSILYQ